MFEDFKKITITGGCFISATEFELFKKDAMSVIYGRNGSGKTTIAHSIAELIKPDEERNPDYTVTSDVAIPEDKRHSVFIFDEDFVRNQVRVEQDGINTIVMLGEQIELDELITKKKDLLTKKEDEYRKLKEEREDYDNAEKIISPLYFFNQIKDALRADDGWADIDRDVKGNTLKSRIIDDVVNTLIELEEPAGSYEQLRERVMTDLKLYLKSENAQELVWSYNPVTLPESLDGLASLLAKPLVAPPLSERELQLVTLLSKHPEHSTQGTRQLLNEHWPFCPLCLREINDEDRSNITKTLTDILNKEADDYEGALRAALSIFSPEEIELPRFADGLNEKELNAAHHAHDALIRILSSVRETIEKRRKNIYEVENNPFEKSILEGYQKSLVVWKQSLEALEKCVERFNETVNKRKQLFNQVREENNLLAKKQLSALLHSYSQAVENSKKNINDLNNKGEECDIVRREIKSLQQKKENTDIALEYINKELQYVYYSKRKVRLEPGDGCYKLIIRGRHVAPPKISVGERNVLGLCYFFAKLFGGKTESNKYADEYLLVIDDPVSSFDYGNRIGVMSLLRFQFGNILKGNVSSRILVMSHDLHTVFDLVKIRNEVVPGKSSDKSFMELSNSTLYVNHVRNEYKKLLQYVYDYASSTDTDVVDETQEMGIGNVMRRMMEAFSSFCYNDTFEKVVRREDILDILPREKKNYYANFMCRLTLNTESHMEERIYSLDSLTNYFTKEEKLQTAKSVLLFLYYVNRPHLAAYLDAGQLKTIEGWMTEEAAWLI